MTGRVKIIRVTTEIKAGRKEPTTEVFYECWCDVQSLGTNEKYTALQAGLENTIVFKVRNCKRMKEVRKKMKEFRGISFRDQKRPSLSIFEVAAFSISRSHRTIQK